MTALALRPIEDVVKDLRAFKEKHKYTQEDIAAKAEVPQSDVQRSLAGKKRRLRGNLLKICNYANIDVYENSATRLVDPVYERKIQECIAEIWDGSSQQGKIIVNVLTALKSALR